jgi:HAD superfamily hydrolase (TIGR01544 family)
MSSLQSQYERSTTSESELTKDVIISNAEIYARKFAEIKIAGLSQLQVVADFDRTLTAHFNTDGVVQSSYQMLHGSKIYAPAFTEACNRLYQKYYPIEVDNTLPVNEKQAQMLDWWNAFHDMMIAEGTTRNKLRECVEATKSVLRPGALTFLQQLDTHHIPLLILSAGLGDIIRLFLDARGALLPNTEVVSNFMRFDDNGVATSFIGTPITTFNKNEFAAAPGDNTHTTQRRPNVLLLGDSLSDVDMVNPSLHSQVLKIGFLNDNVDRDLERYKAAFDVVITNDSDMSFVSRLVGEIC